MLGSHGIGPARRTTWCRAHHAPQRRWPGYLQTTKRLVCEASFRTIFASTTPATGGKGGR